MVVVRTMVTLVMEDVVLKKNSLVARNSTGGIAISIRNSTELNRISVKSSQKLGRPGPFLLVGSFAERAIHQTYYRIIITDF